MINIEKFSSDDTDRYRLARAIRHEVFVDEQNVPEELEYENDEEAVNYLLYDAGLPKGTARWRETTDGIKLERFAVFASQRGKGYGTLLLEKILQDVLPLGKRIYLHAQISALSYYLKAGFETEGHSFNEAGIEHYRMVYLKAQEER